MSMHWLLMPVRSVFYRILAWKLRDSRESTPGLVAGLATTLLRRIQDRRARRHQTRRPPGPVPGLGYGAVKRRQHQSGVTRVAVTDPVPEATSTLSSKGSVGPTEYTATVYFPENALPEASSLTTMWK
jgi:hypothetical protein